MLPKRITKLESYVALILLFGVEDGVPLDAPSMCEPLADPALKEFVLYFLEPHLL